MEENKSSGTFKSHVSIGSKIEVELLHPIEIIINDKIGMEDEQNPTFITTKENKEKIDGNG